jgi:hypothetical protein
MASTEEQEETLDLINAELIGRLSRQAMSGSQVDTKAALIAGVAAAAAQFLASRKDPDAVLGTLAYICYATAFVAAVAAYALVRYEDVPEPRGLVRQFAHRTRADTLARLVATRVKVFETNHGKHHRKVVFWWVSVAALGLGLALSTVAIGQT